MGYYYRDYRFTVQGISKVKSQKEQIQKWKRV